MNAQAGIYNASDLIAYKQRVLRELSKKAVAGGVKSDPLEVKNVSYARTWCDAKACVGIANP